MMSNAANRTKRHAFTLIELSIVLIIIGLLTAGVLAGRELIAQAAISAQVNQLREYEVAYTTFKIKYGEDSVPGDFDNAAAFFAGATDGDGDGIVENTGGGTANNAVACHSRGYDREAPEFFGHLQAAGLTGDTSDGTFTLGSGYPELPITNGTGMIVSHRFAASGAGILGDRVQLLETQDENSRTILCLAMANPSEADPSEAMDGTGVASPERMRSLDRKVDDGQPKSGRLFAVRARDSVVGNCTNASPYDEYDITNAGAACNAFYILER